MTRVLSYGGGLDSFAMLVEGLARGERPDVVCFVDVTDPEHQDPGEWPSTYRHVDEVVRPLCEREGIEFEVIDSTRYPIRDARSLFAWLWDRQQIPVAGPNRICTIVAKVERFERWLDDRFPGEEVEVWIGFEAGEDSRAASDPNAGNRRKVKPGQAVRRNRFPLMEWGLCRCRCEALVLAAGYPVPRKSSCTFCPYGTRGDWKTFARELPEQFARVVELEARKPVTKKGHKLSIMGYRTVKDLAGNVVRTVAPMLPVYVSKPYRPKHVTCKVCGGERASKATGCDYLDDNEQERAA